MRSVCCKTGGSWCGVSRVWGGTAGLSGAGRRSQGGARARIGGGAAVWVREVVMCQGEGWADAPWMFVTAAARAACQGRAAAGRGGRSGATTCGVSNTAAAWTPC